MSQPSKSDSPANRALAVRRIAANLGLEQLDPVVWAFLSHADEVRLSSLERSSSRGQRNGLTQVFRGSDVFRDAEVEWLNRIRIPYPRQQQSDPTTAAIANSMNLCYKRSQSCCVTSTAEPTGIAHIASLSIFGDNIEKRKQRPFWKVMHVFFDEERVKKWMAATADPLSIKNMICVSDNVHGLYEKARFALQPISKYDNRITARFYWLPYMKHAVKGLDGFASCDLNLGCSPFGCKLFECATEKKVVSGYEVDFRTENPGKYPLPSWDLLDMQWAMHRVAAWGGVPAYKDSWSNSISSSSPHPDSNTNSNPEDWYGSDDSDETVRPAVIATMGMGATMGVGVRSKRVQIEGEDE